MHKNWLSVMILTITAVAISALLFFSSTQASQGKLDWRSATIEGFRPGTTREEIEAIRGPANISREGYWFWESPDLELQKRGNFLHLTGRQLECQKHIFHCGNRFAMRDALDKPDSAPERESGAVPDSQATVQKAFGQGKVGEELDYLNGQDLMLTFVFSHYTEEFSLIKSSRRISSVTFRYPDKH